MTKRKMFLRMITSSLLRRRSRMLIALLSIAIGATILAGLVTIYVDVPRQMGAQFRSYGANMLLLPKEGTQLNRESLSTALSEIPGDALVGASPYRYVRLDMTTRQQSFTAAATDFTQVVKTSPYFSVEGSYPSETRQVLVGKGIAETIGVRTGSTMELTYQPTVSSDGRTPEESRVANATLSGKAEGFSGGMVYVTATLDSEARIATLTVDASTQTPEYGGQIPEAKEYLDQFIGKSLPVAAGDVDVFTGATVTSEAVLAALNQATLAETPAQPKTLNFTVTGILTTGGEEEGYVFMSLDDMELLTGTDQLDVAELSVSAGADELEKYAGTITERTGINARLVKRVARSEAAVLEKLTALVFLVTLVVLLLTLICVSTTMMAVVSERRKEIGLRKALGASDGSIRAEFLGEGLFLGLLGGILGAILGFAFAQVVSIN
ncbi:MAG: FMN-binding protein, partial [Clostridia bacterium]|nr:FMN-binding protein [Clostridia bacterium]